MTLGVGSLITPNGDYPSFGTHTSDGFRSGMPCSNGYEIGNAPGVINSPLFTFVCKPADPTTSPNQTCIAPSQAMPSSGNMVFATTAIDYITAFLKFQQGTFLGFVDVPYGRRLQIFFSAATSAAAPFTITVSGYDYGGYKVVSSVTISSATTAITLPKCMQSFEQINFSASPWASGSNTVSAGVSNAIGLPYYYVIGTLNLSLSGAQFNLTGTSIVVGDNTYVLNTNTGLYGGTITSGDPRGVILCPATDGTKFLFAEMFVFGGQVTALIEQQANYLQWPPMIPAPQYANPDASTPTESVYSYPFNARYGLPQYSQPLI